MPVLSAPDPTANVACTLPVVETAGRLSSLQDLVGRDLRLLSRTDAGIRVVIGARDRPTLTADAVAWASAEKECCAFLGFSVDAVDDAVTIEISAPDNAGPTIDAIERLIRAASRPVPMP